jgi:hypothetical protein
LAKEGWPRHQANGPIPLKGADGVVVQENNVEGSLERLGMKILRFENRLISEALDAVLQTIRD